MSEQPTPRSAIAHQVRRAMGRDEPYVLVLHSGEVIPGPVTWCGRDPQLVAELSPAGKSVEARRELAKVAEEDSRSNLVCLTAGAEQPTAVDEIDRVEYR